MWLRASLVSLCCAVATSASAEAPKAPAEMTATDIQTCVQKNFPSDSMIQTVKMVSVDRAGVEHALEADIFWQRDPETKQSNVLLTFDDPPELRGASVLVLEKKPQNDMFMFQPEFGKTRRITTQAVQGKLMGTDFSFEDFQRLQGILTSAESKRLPDATVSERRVFVTESVPSDSASEYSRILSRIDQETCVPLEVDLFTKESDGPAKRMTSNAKTVTHEKSGFMPREIAMKDLRTGTATSIVIEKLEVSVPIDRKRFSQAELERQGRFSAAPTR